MLKLSKAPIPADTIGLAEAFKRVCERVPGWLKIISEMETSSAELEAKNIQYLECSSADALDALHAATDDDFSNEQHEAMRAGRQQQILAHSANWRVVEADRIMREALASGAIVAEIEDLRTGERRAINDVSRWRLPQNSKHEPGFRSDYVEPWDIKKPMPDRPGPPTDFDDQTLHRVFFDKKAFETWLAPASRGAKRGPKFRYDWDEGKLYFLRLMATKGDLDNERQEWSAQADIEREILGHMKEHGGGEPSSSLVQEHVAKWLHDFRNRRNTH